VRSRREDAVKAGGFLTSIPLDVQLEDVERLAKEAMRASGDGKLAAAE
jgi:hypothetical protein